MFEDILYHNHFKKAWRRIKFFYHLYEDFTNTLRAFKYIKDPVVTIFGSGVVAQEHQYYKDTILLGSALAKAGYNILTGGGPGLMEAANQGALQYGLSYSCRIALKFEQSYNSHLYHISPLVNSFWLRKLFLIRPARAFVVVPGGFGTLDEVFEVLTLLRTAKIKKRQVIFFNTAYWKFLQQFIETSMIKDGMIDVKDLALISWVDTAEEVVALLTKKEF